MTTNDYHNAEPAVQLSDPRQVLRRRCARMVTLIDMDAPTIVIEGEFRLIEHAMTCLRILEGDKRTELRHAS